MTNWMISESTNVGYKVRQTAQTYKVRQTAQTYNVRQTAQTYNVLHEYSIAHFLSQPMQTNDFLFVQVRVKDLLDICPFFVCLYSSGIYHKTCPSERHIWGYWHCHYWKPLGVSRNTEAQNSNGNNINSNNNNKTVCLIPMPRLLPAISILVTRQPT